jgi:DNA mismatch repair protein PMS2
MRARVFLQHLNLRAQPQEYNAEVRFKELGAAYFEVIDDGPGIGREDFATLCKKYCTSKIAQFEDLETLSSLGFRGEALSSLCAVGTVTVLTSTALGNGQGTRLVYDAEGNLISEETSPRSVRHNTKKEHFDT